MFHEVKANPSNSTHKKSDVNNQHRFIYFSH